MTRKHYAATLLAVLILASCSKTAMETNTPAIIPPLPDASYTMQVTTYWSSPAFVAPAGVHITDITGMVHTPDTLLWKPGLRATPRPGRCGGDRRTCKNEYRNRCSYCGAKSI